MDTILALLGFGDIGSSLSKSLDIGKIFASLPPELRIGGPLVTGLIVIFIIYKLGGILPRWLQTVLIILAVVIMLGGVGNILALLGLKDLLK